MKSTKQQKRKIIEVIKKQDCAEDSFKKSANGTSRGSHNATESLSMTRLEPQIQRQIPSAKIKLQLFPINENIRLGLEKDCHNPFLELTLSAGKKISSVIRHLNSKWGGSSVAIGQIMLFPYNSKLEQLASNRKWTSNDTEITAGEVYVILESPSAFRLRYGWYPIFEVKNRQEEKLDETGKDIQKQINLNEALHTDVNAVKALGGQAHHVDNEVTTNLVPTQPTLPWDDSLTNFSIGGLLSEASLLGKISNPNPNTVSDNELTPQHIFLPPSDISIGGLLSEASVLSNEKNLNKLKMEKSNSQFYSPWDDNLTTLSIGGLFSEASLQGKTGSNPLRQKDSVPFSDSFDAFIAAQLNYNSEEVKPIGYEPNLSILDAEETCHAFRFSSVAKINDGDTMLAKDSPRQEPSTVGLPRPLGAFDEDGSFDFSSTSRVRTH